MGLLRRQVLIATAITVFIAAALWFMYRSVEPESMSEERVFTIPAEPVADLDEEVIALRNDPEAAYAVRLLLDEFPGGTEVIRVRAAFSLPDWIDVVDAVPNANNLAADRVTIRSAEDGLHVEAGNADGSPISFANRDGTRAFITLTIKLNRELTVKMNEELKVEKLEIGRADGKTSSYDTGGASASLQYNPPASAVGKLPRNGNPLVSHKFGADPYVLVYKDRVYVYATYDQIEHDAAGEVKDNTYSKINKLSVISSDDLMNWTDHGAVHAAGPDGAAKWATQSWAPAAAHKVIDGKDKFFLYFANNASGIGVLTSDSPAGPWVDPIGKPLIGRSDPAAEGVHWLFDPAVFVDDDGKAYLYYGGGVPEGKDAMPNTGRAIRLGDDMVSVVGEAAVIPAPFMFESAGINKVNGVYYYTYCSNFYNGVRPEGSPPAGEIAYMTSDSPMGPWTYRGTMLKNPGHFFGVGGNNHHVIFRLHDAWYVAYHAQTLSKAMGVPKGYRSTHLNRVIFNEDGTIEQVAADMKGVEQIKSLDPYARTLAATIAWSAGIAVEPRGTDGLSVADIDDGDWTAISQVDFGEGAATVKASVKSLGEGGSIELRLDGPEGRLIGTLEVPAADGSDRWIEPAADVTGAEGVHDLYFVFRGKPEQKLFLFDWWQFER